MNNQLLLSNAAQVGGLVLYCANVIRAGMISRRFRPVQAPPIPL